MHDRGCALTYFLFYSYHPLAYCFLQFAVRMFFLFIYGTKQFFPALCRTIPPKMPFCHFSAGWAFSAYVSLHFSFLQKESLKRKFPQIRRISESALNG